jgi:hypothetical protein
MDPSKALTGSSAIISYGLKLTPIHGLHIGSHFGQHPTPDGEMLDQMVHFEKGL